MEACDTRSKWAELVKGGFFADYTDEARRRYQKSATALQLESSAWIVEVGCGTGRYHRLLREIGYRSVVSCDLTREHLARAREIDPDGLFVVASGENLPFKTGVFDGLATNAAIEHFADPAKGVQEFARVTAQDGRLVVTSDCYSWRLLQLLGLYRSKMPIDRTLTFGGFRALFHAAGLEIVEADAWGVTHYLRRLARVSPLFGRLAESASRDDHWSNRKTTSRRALRLRMLLLDENLFVLAKMPGTHRRVPAVARNPLRLLEVLACTRCRGALSADDGGHHLSCRDCGAEFPLVDGIPSFV
jgi:SAM-dependent methyltransferase